MERQLPSERQYWTGKRNAVRHKLLGNVYGPVTERGFWKSELT
jgi:hypothetical protein